MDVFSEIMKPIVKLFMKPVMKQLGYLISCTKYVREMRTKMKELDVARRGEEDHLNRNIRSRLEISSQVRGWLEDVEKTNAKVENFPSEVGSCFSLAVRHKLGRKASNIIQEIDSVTRQHEVISWTDGLIPLGKVDSMKAFASTSSSDHNDFHSREQTFTEALKALGPNHKSHMIALWGMGGVGKTTMMQKLKKVVKEKKMFNFIVEAVIGEKTDPIAIQEAVANYLGIELKEKTKPARADKLREGFEANSNGGKVRFLIILDDVWQSIDLEDIGLSPFPNQGVNFNVLLTSRNRDVCTMMGVEANSILKVRLLAEAEAQKFFRQVVEISNVVDHELDKIGEDIVSKCCGLPIAIKTMACTLRNKRKDTWNDALSRLEHHDIDNVVPKVFQTSYDNLQGEETKSIFLLCGLYPEDCSIPTEDLVRYGWGLKLFKRVFTIGEARSRLNSCIERLVHTNLLTESDDGCVKMHDLVRAFVLEMYSKVEHASIVNHGSTPGWPEIDMGVSCTRISLSCKGMTKFPRDLKFPTLSLLKLMHGDELLRFPHDFYGEMQKLQVISFDKIKYPLLPSSPQCSTNLRVLHLHQCSLMFDCSSIGNLLNLEVLSFANSCIEWLPSAIGNLKKLRLLDLADCASLRVDNSVFKNLVKLEELYMIHGDQRYKAITFTDDNCNEIAERSKNLFALEFEFYRNNAQPKDMSFENLERFKISVGRSFDADYSKSRYSFENTLQLVTNKRKLLESRMNELFEKTKVLCLSVNDMNDLEDVEVSLSHRSQSSSLYNLRVLVISDCAELRYVFTLGVAKALSKLEHLYVDSCDSMEELIHTESSEETINFPNLKFLSLRWLPKLSGLCNNSNIIELPQLVELKLSGIIPNITSIYPRNKLATSCLLKREVVIPKLEKLHIFYMETLKEIWPCECIMSEEVKLREIFVSGCGSLVNLFPCNPMSLVPHLEELELWNCGSIEVLFNIDLDCFGESGQGGSSSTSLRSIKVESSEKLREVWTVKGANNSNFLIRGFQAVESIDIRGCKRFANILTPTTTNLDLGSLTEIFIDGCREGGRNNESVESNQEQGINFLSQEEISQVSDSISNVAFPSRLIDCFYNLRKLELWSWEGMEVVFEIESPRSRELVTTPDNQLRLLPNLEELHITFMERMSHVWKCNWNKFLILQKHQSRSPFHNLTTIHMIKCKIVTYLFSPLMAKLLTNLNKVEIRDCDDIEEIVSNIYDEDEEMSTSTDTIATLFPCLNSLTLSGLKNLKHIGGGGAKRRVNESSFNNTITTTTFVDPFKFSRVGDVFWTLCQYSREIEISYCHALSTVIPYYAIGQMQKLQTMKIKFCDSMKEVFETQEINSSISVDEGYGGILAVPRPNKAIILQLPNLKILQIEGCGLLEHLFTFSALTSLMKLEELVISDCKAMKVIVKEEHGKQTMSSNMIVLSRLKSITLANLPNLMGFFLGMNEFHWPLLDYVKINDCPQLMVFTSCHPTAPKTKFIPYA